jgi:hypothetical protein
MDSPPVSEVSDSSLQGVENFYTEEVAGTITPPDSAPASPAHHPFVYTKPHVSHASDFSSPSSSYYPDADANPAVLPSSLDFVPSTRSFWQQFPLFRREEVQSMNAQLAQHNGVSVF